MREPGSGTGVVPHLVRHCAVDAWNSATGAGFREAKGGVAIGSAALAIFNLGS